jgi:type II secretory pathway component HofQ
MFKYIVDILKEFTSKQKLYALVIVLVAIVTITVGPKLVSEFKTDKEEYELIVSSLRKRNRDLFVENEELNNQLVKGRTECRVLLVEKENEVIAALTEIERKMKRQKTLNKVTVDTIVNDGTVAQISEVKYVQTTNPEVMGMVQKLKTKLKNDISSN